MLPIIKKYVDNHPWLVNVIGVGAFIVSPVLVPCMCMWNQREEIKAYFEDCYKAVFTNHNV